MIYKSLKVLDEEDELWRLDKQIYRINYLNNELTLTEFINLFKQRLRTHERNLALKLLFHEYVKSAKPDIHELNSELIKIDSKYNVIGENITLPYV
jgi:hypothetical protein